MRIVTFQFSSFCFIGVAGLVIAIGRFFSHHLTFEGLGSGFRTRGFTEYVVWVEGLAFRSKGMWSSCTV